MDSLVAELRLEHPAVHAGGLHNRRVIVLHVDVVEREFGHAGIDANGRVIRYMIATTRRTTMSPRLRLLLSLSVLFLFGTPLAAFAAEATRLYTGFPYGSQPQASSAVLAEALTAALGRKFTQSVVPGDAQRLALKAVQEEGGGERRLLFAGATMALDLGNMKPVAMIGDLMQPALTFAVYGNRNMPDVEVTELRQAIDGIVKSGKLPFINDASRPDPLPGTPLPRLIEAPVRTAVSGDYDGEKRFPIRPIKLVPNEVSVPLRAYNNFRPDSSLEVPGASYSQIRCDYGPFPDGSAEWSIRFWAQRRPAVAPEIISMLQRRDPLSAPTMIDVVIEKCPKTWGLAVDIGNGKKSAKDIDVGYREADEKAAASGLRFSNQLMFSQLTEDTSSSLLNGKTPPLAQLKRYDAEKQGYTKRLGGFDGMQGVPSKDVAAELDQLINQGYSLLSCAYGFDDERAGLIVRDGSNFWFKKSPPVVSKALAQWIESSKFPLVDVALSKCPKFLAQAIAVGFGTGPAAREAKRVADAAVVRTSSYCDRLQASEQQANASTPTHNEPTAGDICQALETSLKASYAEWNGVADELRRNIPGQAGQIYGGIAGLKTAFMGTAHPEVHLLSKRSCSLGSRSAVASCRFSAGFIVKFKGGSLDRVTGIPRQLEIPVSESTRDLFRTEDGWAFVPRGARTSRDTEYDAYVERDLKNLQLDVESQGATPRGRK